MRLYIVRHAQSANNALGEENGEGHHDEDERASRGVVCLFCFL